MCGDLVHNMENNLKNVIKRRRKIAVYKLNVLYIKLIQRVMTCSEVHDNTNHIIF